MAQAFDSLLWKNPTAGTQGTTSVTFLESHGFCGVMGDTGAPQSRNKHVFFCFPPAPADNYKPSCCTIGISQSNLVTVVNTHQERNKLRLFW